MKRMLLICLLTFGLVLVWSVVIAEEGFYVISTRKKNYAPVEKTGQTKCFEYDDTYPGSEYGWEINCPGTGQDGELQRGTAWPSPRFTVKGNGTVTDNLTGLIWLKSANCIQAQYPGFDNDGTAGDGQVTYRHALEFVTGINSGTYANCGGGYTDWVLPNVKELQSLIHHGLSLCAIPNTAGTGPWMPGDPFNDVICPGDYWSSTTYLNTLSHKAWVVFMGDGRIYTLDKWNYGYVWPVRGGN